MLSGVDGRTLLIQNRAEAEQFEDSGIAFSVKPEVRDVPEDVSNTFLAIHNLAVSYILNFYCCET